MEIEEIVEMDQKHFMNVYSGRYPLYVEKAEGIKLHSKDGKIYRDFLAGIGVNALGYSNQRFKEALKDQIDKIIHCSNLYYIEPQAELEKKLCKNSCYDRVFFANSGSEANEGALKLARKYFKKKGSNKFETISADKSFHGRTMTTVTATGQNKYKEPFVPLPEGFYTVPFNDLEALKEAVTDRTGAILLEPIQGEGGIYPAEKKYLEGVRKLCDQNDILLIFDEVQCGMGRTGELFAYQNYGVEADIITLAKALGGGVPIGAFMAKEEVAAAFEAGDHGTTFGGNPLATRAASEVMDIMLENNFLASVKEKGNYLRLKLDKMVAENDNLIETRGIGLMLALELGESLSAKKVTNQLFERGFLVNAVKEHTLRFLPPLVVEKEDIDLLIKNINQIITEK
ncbi:Acetylornithine aminotransferase [Halanaerobium saccharolyticum subsp. saccharolyticum DSM 6643]|uniref:Acetylornithine aminotransferase n=1 Tax=Halanaerobium saccharolyticum subsp. saccharolyticum DSM 6643 TaxID=1293054 RepID=M5E2B3_9FIRM|nr:aspartate aminotransferase family protein [Halanaerobium saccharolyticum]CCU80653.1 Acetylornithine aminotransferase [Halanaerobium saccharolyticum subsp. saccharolyticum DSM 6643]